MKIDVTPEELLDLMRKYSEGAIRNVPVEKQEAAAAAIGNIIDKENEKSKGPGQGGGISI